MKFFGIIFATTISFISLLFLDSVETQVKRYESFEDFLEDLKNTADSLVDYVMKIQALLCPDQPICSSDGVLEREDVLGTLPAALTVGNRTVKLQDVSSFIGVCCLPCSCADSCRQVDSCCPTKQPLPDMSNETSLPRKECIAATLLSYRNKKLYDEKHASHMYYMTTDCFHDDANFTALAHCQQPNTGRYNDIVPVTSQNTGSNYWNSHCAICNNDADGLIEWMPVVKFKQALPFFWNWTRVTIYPETAETFQQFITSQSLVDIVFTPPTPMEDNVCIRKEIVRATYCKQSTNGAALTKFDWLTESCKQVYSPIKRLGHRTSYLNNIFCFICRNTIDLADQKYTCSLGRDGEKTSSGYVTGLLNYKREQETSTLGEDGPVVEEGRCGCAEIFDPYLKFCRSSFCPAGDIQAGCQCIQPLKNLSGLPVLLKVNLAASLGKSNLLTNTQLRMMHKALTKILQTIAEHTTAEIATTFQQENMTDQSYLCIVIVRSDPGHDTKLTMKPFMNYLDTEETLQINAGKFVFSTALTSKVLLWTEWDEMTKVLTFKAQDIEKTSNEFVKVYANDAIMRSEIRLGRYQVLSALLYCKQLQLNEAEYYQKPDLITVNVTISTFSIFDFYKIPPSQVRVCVEDYLRKSKGNGNKTSGKAVSKVSYGLFISTFVVVMLVLSAF